MASSLGVPDDAKVFVAEADGSGKAFVSIKHPSIKRMDRMFDTDENGDRFIKNEFLEIKDKGKGMGSEIFKNQVENAMQNGFAYIETLAGGSPKSGSLNGYYTWPLLGYNGSIDDISEQDVIDKVKQKFPEAKTIRDVMRSEGGRKWWKENGGEFKGRFDLTPDSESFKQMDAYLTEKAKKSAK